jgi:hypothetical protein
MIKFFSKLDSSILQIIGNAFLILGWTIYITFQFFHMNYCLWYISMPPILFFSLALLFLIISFIKRK